MLGVVWCFMSELLFFFELGRRVQDPLPLATMHGFCGECLGVAKGTAPVAVAEHSCPSGDTSSKQSMSSLACLEGKGAQQPRPHWPNPPPKRHTT